MHKFYKRIFSTSSSFSNQRRVSGSGGGVYGGLHFVTTTAIYITSIQSTTFCITTSFSTYMVAGKGFSYSPVRATQHFILNGLLHSFIYPHLYSNIHKIVEFRIKAFSSTNMPIVKSIYALYSPG